MDMHFEGIIFQTHARELERRIRRPFPPSMVLDVRPAADYAAGHVPESRSATLSQLREALPDGADASTEFVVLGAGPQDALVRQASLALKEHGALRCVEFPGGMVEWVGFGLPVESASGPAA